MTGFAYLASPYSHPDPHVQRLRYQAARSFVAWAAAKREWVFSPILHGHDLACAHRLPSEAEYWQPFNHAMISASRALYLLRIDGWESSVGGADGLSLANDIGRPICPYVADGDGWLPLNSS